MVKNYILKSGSKTSDWFSHPSSLDVVLAQARALLRRPVQQTRFNFSRLSFESTP
jgi:hypothetical protein